MRFMSSVINISLSIFSMSCLMDNWCYFQPHPLTTPTFSLVPIVVLHVWSFPEIQEELYALFSERVSFSSLPFLLKWVWQLSQGIVNIIKTMSCYGNQHFCLFGWGVSCSLSSVCRLVRTPIDSFLSALFSTLILLTSAVVLSFLP